MNQQIFHKAFNGDDYQPARDDARLTGQILRVFDCMKDGRERTLRQIALETGDPESSVSAQLRHLRKDRFGGHTVHKTHVQNGLYKYRLELKTQNAQITLFDGVHHECRQ